MDDTIVISIFMALEGVHAYSAFLPSVFTIQTFVSTEGGHQMIREGEVMASVVLAGLAIATSMLTKSPWPAIMACVMGTAMIGVYEWALRRAPVNQEKSTSEEYY
jgi:hypothetical protein